MYLIGYRTGGVVGVHIGLIGGCYGGCYGRAFGEGSWNTCIGLLMQLNSQPCGHFVNRMPACAIPPLSTCQDRLILPSGPKCI